MKIKEVFEYEVDTNDMSRVFTIKDYVDCVDDMCCPFWDGYTHPRITKRDLQIIEK